MRLNQTHHLSLVRRQLLHRLMEVRPGIEMIRPSSLVDHGRRQGLRLPSRTAAQ